MPKGNDQIVRTVPGTDVGGHDTSGVDGEKRTERAGEILGTPDAAPSDSTVDARELEGKRTDFVTAEVDRTNREVLPKLGGPAAPEEWKAEKGGVPEFIANARTITPRRETADSGGEDAGK